MRHPQAQLKVQHTKGIFRLTQLQKKQSQNQHQKHCLLQSQLFKKSRKGRLRKDRGVSTSHHWSSRTGLWLARLFIFIL